MIYNRTCNKTSSEAYQLCFWFWHSMITLDTGSWHRQLIMTPDNDIRHWQLTKAVDNDIWHWQLTRTFGTGSWQWHLTRKEVSKASTMTWWYFTVSSLMLLMNHLKQRVPNTEKPWLWTVSPVSMSSKDKLSRQLFLNF